MNSEKKKESVVLPNGNDEKNVTSAAAEKNNDINTNNSENETIATDILNNSPKATTTDDNTTPVPSSSTNTADTPTSKSPGFFSRIGTLGNSVGSGAPLLGDKLGNVYEKAQKRAVELHEQAVTEVERLRQQQKEEDKLNNIVIPPSSGTLIVDGSEVTAVSSSELQDVLNNEKTTIESSVVGRAAKDGSAPKVKETKSSTFPNVSSPLRDAFNIVRQQSLQSAERLVFPVEAFATGVSDDDATAEKGGEDEDDDSRYLSPDSSNVSSSRSQEDDSSNVSSPEKEGGDKKEVINTTSATSTSSLTPTRFTGVFNATVGRYRRRLQESASFDSQLSSSSDQQQQQQSQQSQPQEVLVGGADRVGGLRYFQLDSIIDKDTMSSKLLPPTMPFSTKPPGQENLVKETGGQWTMASNRGQNAVTNPATNSHTSFSRSPSWDATSTTAASESGSAISEDGSKNRLPPSSAASPKPSHKSTRTPSYYEEAVRAVLQPGQRALFFGKGTMGVVLKPTYHASWRGKDGGGLLSPTTASKKGGVFIDSMISGGHADKTGVVFVGDHVIKIGAVNVESMTLEEVVTVISQTKRPNIMVVTSEHSVKLADKPKGTNGEGESTSTGEKGFVTQLDLTFGFINKLVAEGEGSLSDQDLGKDHELKQVVSRNSLLDNDDEEEDSEEEVSFKSPSKGQDNVATYDDVDTDKTKEEETETAAVSEANNVGKDPESNPVDANTSAADDLGFLSVYASHRTNNYDTSDTDIRHQRTSLLKRSALFNQHFRSALHGSLLDCVLDPRKYSFLEHYLKNYQSKKQIDAKAKNGSAQEAKLVDDDDVTSAINQRRLLELYVELCKFHDAMMVCSESEREKLLGYARDISTRFLEDIDQGSNRNCLSERVSQVALGGMEKVQAVGFALNDEDSFFEEDNGDGFESIRSSLGAFLSTQEAFLSFLISNECASMRAYLRGCSPFLQIEPHMFLKPPIAEEEDTSTHNLLLHAIFHLVCMKENDEDEEQGNFIRNDALRFNTGKRNLGASSLLGCSSFIMRKLQKSIEAVGEGLIEDGMMGNSINLPLYLSFIEQMQFFWEVYVAPAGGALSSLMLSQDAQKALNNVRRLLVSSVDEILAKEESKDEPMTTNVDMARALSSGEMSTCIVSLAEALLREYTLKIYPDFQRFIFFEWACKESKEHRFDTKACSNTSYVVKSTYNGMSNGFLNRALRQIEFPHGMSLHRPPPSMDISPTLTPPASDTSSDCLHNGDVALVFGSDTDEEDEIRRFSCVSLQPETSGPRKVVLPEDVPPIFESYASVPPFSQRPFQGMLKNEKNNRMSIDGWEVSLTNFVIPSQGSGESDDDKWMYCVSLVFRKSFNTAPQVSEREINNACVQELQHDDSLDETTSQDFKSPLSMSESEDDEKKRTMKVSQELKQFNCKLQEKKWSQQVGQGSTIGLALISSRNVTSAMRETLSLLYEDFCGHSNEGQDAKRAFPKKQHLCQPLVDILGTLHTQEIEATSLGCVLQPYLTHTTSRWVHRPLSDQADIFAKAAGMQLLQALPPVPLALAFVTLLLEQKVVFASSRRGMLMSASFAMAQLLKPLKWAHLQVPLVPVSMLDELIHYPAPFMLGIPTDEKKSASVLGSLPSDVTLIDLDVGRVILASEFSNDTSKTSEGINSDAVAGALRSQVLFLSECLGGSFGAAIYRNSWCSDSPLQTMSKPTKQCTDNDFTEVLHICEDFISEFISGIHSCCLWIEEKHDSITTRNESAIIFDEDRFYHIKNLRAEGRYLPLIQKSDNSTADKLSLSLDQFDLIFETFLRTQCLSTYISEGDKELMLFS